MLDILSQYYFGGYKINIKKLGNMDTWTAVREIVRIRGALQILAALNLTADLFPPSATVLNGASYDYVIAGGGTAGCVVANRLTENPNINVLLIEAGGDPPLESIYPKLLLNLRRSSSDWNYTAEYRNPVPECSSKARTNLFIGKMLGGTSGLDYMLYCQGNYRDYHSWATAAKDSSWELKNILPYIVKAENLTDREVFNSPDAAFHGFHGPMALKKFPQALPRNHLRAVKEMGKEVVPDVNVYHSVGYTEGVFHVDDYAYRHSTAYSYVRPIKDRPNLYVLKHTTVSKILFDGNKNAIAVEAVTDGRRKIIIRARKEVIVSAGAINTPKLLMLSGIGPKEHLRSKNINVVSDLPVGRNLQDHVAVILIHNMTKIKVSPGFNDPNMYPGNTFNGYLSLNNLDYPDYESLNFINYPKAMAQFCSIVYEFTNTICDNLFKTSTNTQMLWTMIANLHPKSRGHVLLRSSNFTDSPMVFPELFSNEEDLKKQVSSIKDFIGIVNTRYFRSIGAVFKDPNIQTCDCKKYKNEEYWKCYATCLMTPLHHYCGTCAMGTVVDGKLRVRGVRRLRVVDASVMPTLSSGGTFGPTVFIAEKAADMIKQGF